MMVETWPFVVNQAPSKVVSELFEKRKTEVPQITLNECSEIAVKVNPHMQINEPKSLNT